MKTVLLVHGYNGIPKIYDYFRERLGEMGYRVVVPDFPTQESITVEGYFEVFDRHAEVFEGEPIVIAHSIGNEMVIKYICARGYQLGMFIGLAGFVQPFVVAGRDDLNKVLASVVVSDVEKKRFVELVGKRFAIYSDNDHIVPLPVLEEFCKEILADGMMIPGIGHMGSKSGVTELPEVVKIFMA